MCKTKCNNEDCKQCLFNVCSLDIIWSSLKKPEFIYYETGHYEIFLSLKCLFNFFVPMAECTFFKKVTSWKCNH